MSVKTGEAWHDSRELDIYDVGLTLAASPVAVPVMLVGAGAVAAADHVSPIFLQERVGQQDTIEVPKLTTLGGVYQEVPRHGGYDDPRASRVGSFLRKAHIDELPQSLLILSRKMTLVGPRAVTLAHDAQIRSELTPLERARRDYTFKVCRPGLALNYSVEQHLGEGDITPSHRTQIDFDWALNGSRRKYFAVLRNNLLAVSADLAKLDIQERPGHPQTVAGFEHIARHFGVQVNDDDRTYWRSMLTVSRALDIHVDEDRTENVTQLASRLLAGEPIAHMTADECEEFKQVFWSQTAQKQNMILAGTRIDELADRLQDATIPKAIIEARHAEAELFAGILALPVSETATDKERRVAFNEWLVHFSRAGFILDSLLDQSADYALGITSVRPSRNSTFTLGRVAFQDLRKAYKDIPRTAIPGMALGAASKFIRNTVTAPL